MNSKLKELMRYVFPSVGGLCVLFLYNIVDGIFVGQGAGKVALGAVNISVPFVTVAMALATMLPMGGATIIAIRTEKGDKGGAKALPVFSLSFIPMAVNLIIGGYFFSVQRIMQANIISVSRGVVLKAIAIFAVPMIFGKSVIWLSPLVSELITLIMSIAIFIAETNKEKICVSHDDTDSR